MKSQSTNRIFSLIVALLLVVTSFSIGVFAQDGDDEAEVGAGEAYLSDTTVETMPNLDNLEPGIEPPGLALEARGQKYASGAALGLDTDTYVIHERRTLLDQPLADRYEARNRLDGGASNGAAVGTTVTVGDYYNSYTNPTSMQMRVVAKGANVDVYLATALPTDIYNGVAAMAQSIADEFDYIYNMETNPSEDTYIGRPLYDYRGRSNRIKIMIYDIGGKGNSSGGGYTAGFVDPNDLYGACNDDLILYMDAARNYGYSVLMNDLYSWSGTMAHEFQHLLNASAYLTDYINGVYSSPVQTPTWLDEGLAGVMDIEYTGLMSESHFYYMLNNTFAGGTGYVPTDSQWANAGEGVYANYGAAAALMHEYYQYYAVIPGSSESLAAVVADTRRTYDGSKQNVGDHANLGGFDNFFELAAIDMAVANSEDNYDLLKNAGVSNVYYNDVGDWFSYLYAGTVDRDSSLWGAREMYARSGTYAGVTPISEGVNRSVSTNRNYYSQIFLGDAVGVSKNAINITVPDNSADYYIITPYELTNVDDSDKWNVAPKIAAKLSAGANEVTVGTNNQFAVVVINYGSSISGDISYQTTRTGGVLDATEITTDPTKLVSTEGGIIKLTVVDVDQIANSFTAKMVKTDDPTAAVGGFTFDSANNSYPIGADNKATVVITADNTVKAGSYSVELTVALKDGTEEIMLSAPVIFTVTPTLKTPADGAIVDPAATANIRIDFDGRVAPVAGGKITLGSSGTLYTAVLQGSESLTNTLTIPIDSFKDGSTNVILQYDEEYEVTVEAGAVVDAYEEKNATRVAGTFYTQSEGADPSVIPTNLTIAKGSTGAFAAFFGTSGEYTGASITEYDESIVSLNKEEMDTSGEVVEVKGEKVGSTKLTIGFSGGDGETTRTVSVTVTGDADPDPTPTRPGRGSSGGGSSGGTSVSDQQREQKGSGVVVGSAVTKDEGVKAAQDAIKVAQGAGDSTATVRFINKSEISQEVMKAMAAEAEKAGIALRINADVVENNVVVLRITFDPSKATKDIKLGGAVSETAPAVVTIATRFGKYFDNELAILSLNQAGDFGMQVHIAAKVDLSKLNTQTLNQYYYDSATNNYSRIAGPNTFIDTKNYLHFDTVQAGAILTSDKAMTMK